METQRTASEVRLTVTTEEQDKILAGMLASLTQWIVDDLAKIVIDSLAECAQERSQEASLSRPTMRRWVSLEG